MKRRPLGTLERVRPPKCANCDSYACNRSREEVRVHGVLLKPGQRVCLYGKHPHRFKNGDPQIYVPKWCGKKKNPCVLRCYGLSDTALFFYAAFHKKDRLLPSESDFVSVGAERVTDYAVPKWFWDEIKAGKEPDLRFTGHYAHTGDLIEVDDGLEPQFFFYNGSCWYIARMNADKMHQLPKAPAPSEGEATE